MHEILIRTIRNDIDRLQSLVNIASRAGNAELAHYYQRDLDQKRRDLAKLEAEQTAKSLCCDFARVSLTICPDPRTTEQIAADAWAAEYSEDTRALVLGL